jgi:hypothetical protein
MTKTAKPRLTLVFQVETQYGTARLVGRVCHVNADGELRNFLGDRFEDGAEFGDFAVSAWLPHGHQASGPSFGCTADYLSPYRVELYRAELMVKLLRKVNKGLERLSSERGWVPDGDFAQYALRVAEILGVREFYVHNDATAQAMTGQKFRRTDGAGVQMWVEHKVRQATGTQAVRS